MGTALLTSEACQFLGSLASKSRSFVWVIFWKGMYRNRACDERDVQREWFSLPSRRGMSSWLFSQISQIGFLLSLAVEAQSSQSDHCLLLVRRCSIRATYTPYRAPKLVGLQFSRKHAGLDSCFDERDGYFLPKAQGIVCDFIRKISWMIKAMLSYVSQQPRHWCNEMWSKIVRAWIQSPTKWMSSSQKLVSFFLLFTLRHFGHTTESSEHLSFQWIRFFLCQWQASITPIFYFVNTASLRRLRNGGNMR